MTPDVLEDDDRVVHEHPDREGEPGEADHVHGPTEREQHHHRADDRDRNRHADDEERAPRAQEREQDEKREKPALPDVRAHELERVVDVGRLVVDHPQGKRLRKSAPRALGRQHAALRVQLLDRGAHAAHHLDDVGADLLLHVDGDDRRARAAHEARRLLVGDDDVGEIGDAHRAPPLHRDHDGADRLGRLELADRAHGDLALRLAHRACARVAVRRHERGHEIVDHEPTLRQALRLEAHLKLALAAAEHADLGHARDAFEPRLDAVLREVLERSDVERLTIGADRARAALEHDPRDVVAVLGVARLDDGLVDVRRVRLHLPKLVAHLAHCVVRVGSHRELEPHATGVLARHARHLHEVGDPLQLLLLLLHDRSLDLRRARALPEGRHAHDRARHGGRQLDRQPSQREEPREHHEHDADDDRHRLSDASLDELHFAPSAFDRSPASGTTGDIGISRSLPSTTTAAPGRSPATMAAA